MIGRYSALVGGGESSDYFHPPLTKYSYLYFLLHLQAGLMKNIFHFFFNLQKIKLCFSRERMAFTVRWQERGVE